MPRAVLAVRVSLCFNHASFLPRNTLHRLAWPLLILLSLLFWLGFCIYTHTLAIYDSFASLSSLQDPKTRNPGLLPRTRPCAKKFGLGPSPSPRRQPSGLHDCRPRLLVPPTTILYFSPPQFAKVRASISGIAPVDFPLCQPLNLDIVRFHAACPFIHNR